MVGARVKREQRLRLALFVGAVAALGVAETLAPARARTLSRGRRWPAAAVLAMLAGVFGRLAPPAGLAGAASWAKRRRVGLFNQIAAPPWLAWTVTLVVLDLAVWAQHVLSHEHAGFWRLHRVHHTDPDLDLTTGVRFHPAEIALSALWKGAMTVGLGAPPPATLAFEAWLSTGALFTHANVALPPRIDRVVRAVIVTPASHRLHHRTSQAESRVNFGFGLAAWDRLFGTFATGEVGADERLGVGEGWRSARDQRSLALLTQPLQP